MSIADWLMIAAVLIGPISAVQLTRWIDNRKEIRERKLAIFKTLMATRSYTVSPHHVEALNRIDLEFTSATAKERAVRESWKQYLDLLGDGNISPEQWAIRRADLLVDLLHAMGRALEYEFDKTHIKNATYSPVVHGRIEQEQDAIRRGVISLLEGRTAIPIIAASTSPAGAENRQPAGARA